MQAVVQERAAAVDGPRSVKVLVVHEEEMVRWGWRLIMSRQGWAGRCLGARDLEEALALAQRYEPSVAVLDLDLGDPGACQGTALALQRARPGIKVVLLAGRRSIATTTARMLGVRAVVPRALGAVELAATVRRVAAGEQLYVGTLGGDVSRLSGREREVLSLLAGGATNREIAAELVLSPETIKQHAAAIYRKLSVRNRTEAARIGERAGLVASLSG